MPSTKYAIALLAVRMDTESMLEDARQIRLDRAVPKCGPGTKLCGNRCIPQSQNCRVTGSGKVAKAIGTAVGVGVGAAILARNLRLKQNAPANQKMLQQRQPRQIKIDSTIVDRMDAILETRNDAPKCSPGNKPCGNRCIPEKEHCSTGTTANATIGAGLLGGLIGHDAALNLRIHNYNERVKKGARNGGKTTKEQEQDDTEKAYQTLGLKKNATHEQVKAAYKTLAKKYHPDTNKSPDANKKLADVNAAMDKLDPRKKAAQANAKADRIEKKDSLLLRLDSFAFAKIQDAYKTIQNGFPNIQESFWRVDATPPKCTAGNKICGSRCIPEKEVCKTGSGKRLSILKKVGIVTAVGVGGAALGAMVGHKRAGDVIAAHEGRHY